MAESDNPQIDFRTDPSRYRHWKVAIDGRVVGAQRGGALRAADTPPGSRRGRARLVSPSPFVGDDTGYPAVGGP